MKSDNEEKRLIILNWSVAIFIIYSLVRSFLIGFRWPSDYVLTCHVTSYLYGFLPRSLVGEIGRRVWGNNWYSWKVITGVILSVSAFFMVWTVYETIRQACFKRNYLITALLGLFAISPYSKFFLQEAGYYEQYGFVILIILIYLCKDNSFVKSIFIPSIVAFFILILYESSIFLIVPVIFAFSFIRLVNVYNNIKTILKELALLIVTYIPHVLYCLYTWMIKPTFENIQALQEHDYNCVNSFTYYNFEFRTDVHWYFVQRTSEEYPPMLRPIPLWCFLLPLFLVIFISIIIFMEKNIRLLISYDMMAIVVGLSAYLISIVAWDMSRFCFCIFMSEFFLAYFIAQYYLKDVVIRKEHLLLTIIMFLLTIILGKNRLVCFDVAWYNGNIQDFVTVLRQRISF